MTVAYSDTCASPQGCHCNRRILLLDWYNNFTPRGKDNVNLPTKTEVNYSSPHLNKILRLAGAFFWSWQEQSRYTKRDCLSPPPPFPMLTATAAAAAVWLWITAAPSVRLSVRAEMGRERMDEEGPTQVVSLTLSQIAPIPSIDWREVLHKFSVQYK